ncbi:MAG: PfkB family carbohydrate kinase [Elusimicrobiaceae bacterium]|nr:PfkB family carbohydrate kinase [Elusimicrobiaceae bacterium]
MDNSIVVVGSVAFDSIETVNGNTDRALGGSAVYFSVAASSFTKVRLVGVAGDDFGDANIKRLRARKIDVSGLEIVKGGRTFHWRGSYDKDYNEATTKKTELNVFETFNPALSKEHRASGNIFLANIDPELQMQVLRQVEKPRLVACDTMNFWIAGHRAQLLKLLRRVNILFINETEVRMLTGEHNLIVAGRLAQKLGPEAVIVKRGASGATLFKGDECVTFPAYPVEKVVDPTGAGDSFGGGFMGYISTVGNWRSFGEIKKAMAYGTVVSSFNVESFSIGSLFSLKKADVSRRFARYVKSLRIA